MLLVIGKPIQHSLSPKIHNFWLKKYNINQVYEKRELEEKDLKDIIEKIKQKRLTGVNVTIPYKTKIFDFVDEASLRAKKSNAINTLYFKDNQVIGENTDGLGFVNSLEEEGNLNIENKNIFLIGSGGAAKGIIAEMLKRKINSLTIANRTLERAIELKELFSENKTPINIQDWQCLQPDKKTDVIVNTTSVGMKRNQLIDIDSSDLKQDVILYDIIYNPAETELIKKFKKKGFKTINGLGMLIQQASMAFSLWFDINLSNEDLIQVRVLCEKSD